MIADPESLVSSFNDNSKQIFLDFPFCLRRKRRCQKRVHKQMIAQFNKFEARKCRLLRSQVQRAKLCTLSHWQSFNNPDQYFGLVRKNKQTQIRLFQQTSLTTEDTNGVFEAHHQSNEVCLCRQLTSQSSVSLFGLKSF